MQVREDQINDLEDEEAGMATAEICRRQRISLPRAGKRHGDLSNARDVRGAYGGGTGVREQPGALAAGGRL